MRESRVVDLLAKNPQSKNSGANDQRHFPLKAQEKSDQRTQIFGRLETRNIYGTLAKVQMEE